VPIPEHQCGNRPPVAATVPLYPESGTIQVKNEVPDAPLPNRAVAIRADLVFTTSLRIGLPLVIRTGPLKIGRLKTLKNYVSTFVFHRKYLGHRDVPAEVAWDAHFSVTICTLPRGANNLCFDPISSGILNAARNYEVLEKWHVRLLLLMPDHLHLIVTPCLGHSLSPLIADWKRYLCRTYRIKFQRNFFDHRIRDTENFNAQCQYVRENPVRAGLVRTPQDWPWFYPQI
jgi:putative transposase